MKKLLFTASLFLVFTSCFAQLDSGYYNRQGQSPRVPYLWADKGIYLGSWGNKVLSETLDSNNNLIVKKGYTTNEKNNVAIGFNALDSLTTGTQNVALGKLALAGNKVGFQNVAIGQESMRNMNSNYSTAVGAYSMAGMYIPGGVTGIYNTALGYASLYMDSTGGSYNVALGGFTLQNLRGGNNSTTAQQNTAVGYQALQNCKYSATNTAVGSQALKFIDNAGGGSNTAVGQGALQKATSGFSNTIVGTQAGFSATGYIQSLTLVGRNAGYDLTTGGDNIFIGINSGRGITTGRGNTIIGATSYNFPNSMTKNLVLGCDDTTLTDYSKNIYLWIDSNKNTTLYGKLSLPDTATAKAFKTLTGTATDALMGNGSVQTIATGTYTPTASGLFQCTSVTPQVTMYYRIGNMVTVAGQVLMQSNQATASQSNFKLSLPIATTATDSKNLGGAFSSANQSTGSLGACGNLYQSTDSLAQFIVTGITNSSQYQFGFSFTYQIK